MKKILFILGLASLLVTGCGDFFDTAPSNKIPTAIAFRTVTDVDNAVNGLYDLMSGSGYYGAAMFAYGDMKSYHGIAERRHPSESGADDRRYRRFRTRRTVCQYRSWL